MSAANIRPRPRRATRGEGSGASVRAPLANSAIALTYSYDSSGFFEAPVSVAGGVTAYLPTYPSGPGVAWLPDTADETPFVVTVESPDGSPVAEQSPPQASKCWPRAR